MNALEEKKAALKETLTDMFILLDTKEFIRQADALITRSNSQLGKYTHRNNYQLIDKTPFYSCVHPDGLCKEIEVYIWDDTLMCKFPHGKFIPSDYNPYKLGR